MPIYINYYLNCKLCLPLYQLDASRMSDVAKLLALAALFVAIACLLIAIIDNAMKLGLFHATSLYLDYSMVIGAPEFDQTPTQMLSK